MTMKHDKKPYFYGLYAGMLRKSLAAAIMVAMQMAVWGDEERPVFPKGVPEDAVWLTQDDKGDYHSLTAGLEYQRWSGGYKLQEGDTTKNCFVPSGRLARATKGTAVIVPVVFNAGRVNARYTGDAVTFNDLRLLAGGELYNSGTAQKCGNITILSEDPDRPARLCCQNDMTTFSLAARVVGSKESQAFYCMGKASYSANLQLQVGSDWSGFEGTLRIDDGLCMQNRGDAPITMPGSLRFGKGGILQMYNVSGAYSLGNLSFVEDGMVSNRATLTVAGTFDTGKNFRWFSNGAGTFGTLILGDGLTLIDDQETPATVLTVNDQLLVGKDVTIKYPKSSFFEKMPLMKLAPKAVEAGIPDFSDVKVRLGDSSAVSMLRLAAEPDAENEGWYVVYVTWKDPFVYYNGPDEWGQKDLQGSWLDKTIAPAYWGDGLYPDGEKVYCVTQCVYFAPNKVTTFPGKALLCMEDLCLEGSAIVTNLLIGGGGRIYARSDKVRIGGNITFSDDTKIRHLEDRILYVDSALHGMASLTFESYNPLPGSGGALFYLLGDNSDWTGQMSFAWTQNDKSPCPFDVTNHVRIVIGDAKSLGGNTADFSHSKIVLNRYSEIRFTNTTVQTASNRGIYVSLGIINVDSEKTADLSAPVTLNGTFCKFGGGTLGLGGGVRWQSNNDLTDTSFVKEGKNVMLVREGAIKCSSLDRAAVTFSDGTAIAADAKSGAMDLSAATVTAEGTIYLTADGNTLEEPTQAVTYPVVKVSAAQAATLGAKFKAKKSPWRGWPVTVVSTTGNDGSVTYSVKYEKKSFVMSIR